MAKKIQLAVVGLGGITRTFINACRSALADEVSIIGAYSSSFERAKLFSEEFNFPYYGLYEDVLTNKQIDAVYVGNNSADHYKTAKLYLSHKIPVLLEKPLTLKYEEAVDLVRIAQENQVLFMEAMKFTFYDGFNDLLKRLENQQYGPIKYLDSLFYTNKSGNRETRHWKKELGGGSLYDLGCYQLAYYVKLYQEPDNIVVNSFEVINEVEVRIDYTLFKNGVPARLSTSFLGSPTGAHYQQFNIHTDDYYINSDNFSQGKSFKVYDHQGRLTYETTPINKPDMAYEIKHFCDLLRTKQIQSNINTFSFSLSIIKIIDRILREIKLL
ncbi:MAG: Gfo/Idh/MocA family oxidoreductase [Acholeplasmatales bacterium]|jgi:predicted dehydrogenase|nr:Gfo/Idh/MocA family oxidoreductase [Acholeplasmatales bacterium]